MDSSNSIALLVEILVATGVLTAVGELVRWFLGRGKTRVDDAKVVQGMALDLLAPLRAELDRANSEATTLREKMQTIEREMEIIISWALTCKSILDAHQINDYPPMPHLSDRTF